MDASKGLIKSNYFNGINVTPSSVWSDQNNIDYNKVENLLNWDVCLNCRWWSQSIKNSNITFSFNKPLTIFAYSMQSADIVYPTSWEVQYSLNDSAWKTIETRTSKDFFKEYYTTKKFFIKPTFLSKIKFIQLDNSITDPENCFYNCFVVRKFDFFSKTSTCEIKSKSSHIYSYVVFLIISR